MSVTKTLSAETAIEKAFEYFNKFVRPDHKSFVLLEGLELTGGEWQVTIGFDMGRQKEVAPTVPSFFSEKAREPIRHFSVIYIDAHDGSFRRLG